jgi:hypothetical protein
LSPQAVKERPAMTDRAMSLVFMVASSRTLAV